MGWGVKDEMRRGLHDGDPSVKNFKIGYFSFSDKEEDFCGSKF